jgi:DNA-binding PadR family transcriptional regulator
MRDIEEIVRRLRRPQDASGYRLTDAQAEEVARIRRDIHEGRDALATDEQMAALWKSCGL